MPQYTGIPAIPNESIPQWQYDLLQAMKENIEIMMGQRGPGRVVTNDTLGVAPENRQLMRQISARGDFVTVGAFDVPVLEDYTKLLNDVQQLATDVSKIQDALNALLINMRQ
jgi:hypothetical protein